MAIAIVPHDEDKKDLVEEFNATLREAGSPWGFYVDPIPAWIPKTREDQAVWRELHLAVKDGEKVVGGYGLKPQKWCIHGEEQVVADWQGPVSLGAIDNKYAVLGLRLIRDMKKKYPKLYSWGHGGHDQPIVQLLTKMGWLMHETPFLFRVCKPKEFLLQAEQLRQDPRRAMLQDALAHTGLGFVGLHALHQALRLKSFKRFSSEAQVVDRFGDWADELWEQAKRRYSAIAVRDADAMNTLVPAEHKTIEWPAPTRLRITENGVFVGWAVVVQKRLERDPRFGDMRVGMIADAFAVPEKAGPVIHAAYKHLRDEGVDMVMANHSHPAWVESFADNGFVAVQGRRLFCASPDLQAALAPWEQTQRGLFLTNYDGHGPIL